MADALEPGTGADRRERERPASCCPKACSRREPLFRARPWFLTDQYSQLDAAVAPILWRLPHWDVDLQPRRAAPSIERYARKCSRARRSSAA